MAYDDITPAEAAQIDGMNVASQRAGLGTQVDEIQAISRANSGSIVVNAADILTLEGLAVVSGSKAAVQADVDGSAVEIATGTTGITGYLVNVSISGSGVNSFVINSGSNLLVSPTNGSLASWQTIVLDDRVDWIVF